MSLRMLTLPEGKSTFNSKKGGKKIPPKNRPITFFQMDYSSYLYKEILKCYNYETRNPSIYGNVIRCEVELTQGSEQLQLNIEGNDDHLQ